MIQDWLQTLVIFLFFRFGLTSPYTFVFGRFPRPRKCIFWPNKQSFWPSFLKKFHPRHLSFWSLFIFYVFSECCSKYVIRNNVDPQSMSMFFLFCFYFVILFFKAFLEKKRSTLWLLARSQATCIFFTFSQDSLVQPFLTVFQGKRKTLRVQEFGQNVKNTFFYTNQFSILVNPQVSTKDNLCI